MKIFKLFAASVFIALLISGCSGAKTSSGDGYTQAETVAGTSSRSENSSTISGTGVDDVSNNITLVINGKNFSAELYGNRSASDLLALLPVDMDMSELNGNEKYYYFPNSLSSSEERVGAINAGDIMLYGDNCLVIFYESFKTQYSYTPLGRIKDCDGLKEALGAGAVSVRLEAG